MQSLILSGLLAAAAPAAPAIHAEPPAEAPQGGTFLLSIEGVDLAGRSVTGFEVSSWGVDWLAICRIPTGWRLRAGRNATPEGLYEGESTHGVTRLGRLDPLRSAALVRLWVAPQWRDRRTADGGMIPASLAGTLRMSDGRSVKLGKANLRLSPAAACPAPGGDGNSPD